jgi:hypothetical protein
MQTDPVQEWQRLTAHYRELSDGELRQLACEFADLTETAQQALRGEMHSRGLGDPLAPPPARPIPAPIASRQSSSGASRATDVFDRQASPEPSASSTEDENVDSGPHDYTWKTLLCECENSDKAAQLQEALRRAGIESWINFDGSTTPFVPSTQHRIAVGGIRVLVAADELDCARAIAERPIPREIIEELQTEVPEYELPACPKCGAADPVLEAVEPENLWSCEQCGAQWTEPAAGTTEAEAENFQ